MKQIDVVKDKNKVFQFFEDYNFSNFKILCIVMKGQCSKLMFICTISDGPLSPGHMSVSMATMSTGNKPESVNLMKWFGTDVLKNSLPTMPPLPVQGQRVLTLDEIERL